MNTITYGMAQGNELDARRDDMTDSRTEHWRRSCLSQSGTA